MPAESDGLCRLMSGQALVASSSHHDRHTPGTDAGPAFAARASWLPLARRSADVPRPGRLRGGWMTSPVQTRVAFPADRSGRSAQRSDGRDERGPSSRRPSGEKGSLVVAPTTARRYSVSARGRQPVGHALVGHTVVPDMPSSDSLTGRPRAVGCAAHRGCEEGAGALEPPP